MLYPGFCAQSGTCVLFFGLSFECDVLNLFGAVKHWISNLKLKLKK